MVKGFFLVLMTFWLTGCDNRQQVQLQKYIQSVKERPARAIEPIPEFKKLEAYPYSASNERNPFAAYVDMRKNANAVGPDRDRPKEALEAFPLDALKMVGTLQVKHELWGLITAPDGKIYKVRKGDFLGQNYGKIQSIGPDGIQLDEMISMSGTWEKKPATLLLSQVE